MIERFVYVAGRYGDADGYIVIEERINRARQHCANLAEEGIPYYSPHLNSAHFEAIVPHVPMEFWRRQDGAFLPRAAAMLVISHEHDQSAGTVAEIAEAHRLGIPVFDTETFDDLVAWWREP